MSSFEVKVRHIDKVENHPDADRLSICSILGYRAITAKVPVDDFSPDNPDGVRYVHRFNEGDIIVYIPEAAVVPHDLLKQYGYWDAEKDRGLLAGKGYDRVKIVRLRGVYSQGLVWPTSTGKFMGEGPFTYANYGKVSRAVTEGEDVAEFFGITKYEPPIPSSMQGDAAGIAEFAMNYDFDSVQRWPAFFSPTELVVVTEKLHGTFTRVSYRRGVSDDRLFGENKNIAVASKGLGAKGIVMIDTPENRNGNVYVKAAVENDLFARIERLADKYGIDALDIMGETFGPGIQKFGYGFSKPVFRAFDMRADHEYVVPDAFEDHMHSLGIETAPVLYRGVYDIAEIERIRDEPTVFEGAKHVREGVVIRSMGVQTPREHGGERMRPILKAVSPAYLMKEDGSEVQ